MAGAIRSAMSGPTRLRGDRSWPGGGHGTTTRFMPDTEIMHTLDYRFKALAQRFARWLF